MTTPEQNSSAESRPGDAAASPDAPGREEAEVGREPKPDHGRPRIVRAEISRDRGWNSVVEIVLERGGRTIVARQDAVGEETVLFRCAAETTLEAIHRLLGPPERFALVGAKRIAAFDASVVLACVRTLGGKPRRLIGCIPIEGEDAVLAVARAILHATNRLVSAAPNAPETGAAPEPDARAGSKRGDGPGANDGPGPNDGPQELEDAE